MKKKIMLLTLLGVLAMFSTPCLADSSQKGSNATAPQPRNEIWYTSKDGTIVEPYDLLKIPQVFGADIVSNTYQDGKGVIVFDNNIKYIGMMAFREQSNLTSISIPEGVTVIQKWSFYRCTNLSSIIIPNSVVKIGDNAFANCTSLASIYCKSPNPPSLGDKVFSYVASGCKLYVPTTSVETYKATEGWRKFYNTTVGYDFSHKATNKQSDSRKNEQYDPTEEYDVMIEEFALKVDRLEELILNASDSDLPFAYTKQIETLATECEQLHKKLKAAPLDSRQRVYVNEIYADLEDLVKRLTGN